mmetsp:Transcript_6761/g.10550  ORF Transcript_6761/g.10550 Transcript_6761/m.10550 type:complete len:410 (+) Transcript_6761:143-1372(+)|eukprot:CAMPEP_0184661506 /NCGR_PEP_ID=MMETSP0308-20130426/38734_1 /TAXON_ID=38269 /ORGANISM="Gloeochaete witrockiana, Strain SAG 46.84" /LENGTH=409 /DNA_ID=CAMNT_0027102857 /DNA_START=68 /DNA_END=1297 /DNA_ORIENTATION=+
MSLSLPLKELQVPLVKASSSGDHTENGALTPTASTQSPQSHQAAPLKFWPSAWNAIREDKLNILLVFVPLSFIFKFANLPGGWTFSASCLAIVPLSNLLGKCTEELGKRTSDSIAGLLNATFGNAIELIVSMIALYRNYLDVVRASLLGSIIGNLLLVAGCAFFAGGMKYKTQKFSACAAGTSSSLLTLTVLGILLPGSLTFRTTPEDDKQISEETLKVSRFAALVLLATYGQFLVFQLKTHKDEFSDEEGEEEEAKMTTSSAVFMLVAVTVVVSFCGEFLVGSIEEVSESWNLSRTFIGVIVLPIVGNAAEHATAVTMAMKNKMNLALAVVIGSSTQIAMSVIPVLVLAGWAMGRELGLNFDFEQSIILFMSTLLTEFITVDGESNWLEGSMLLAAYSIVSACFFFQR